MEFARHRFSAIFPEITGADFKSLVESIAQVGLLERITTFEGQILDGWNRYRACRELGLSPEFEDFGGDERAALDFVVAKNRDRRHLTPSQCAALAVELEPMYADAAKGRQSANRPELSVGLHEAEKGRAIEHAAVVAGASWSNAAKAKAIKAKDEDLFEDIKSGRTTVNAAKKDLDRRERLAAETAAVATVSEQAKTDLAAVCALHVADIREGLDYLSDGSVDVIITDPPYPADYIPLLSDLSEEAHRVLKPGGLCVVMMGQSYLPEVMRRLGEHLNYLWTTAYLTPGGQAVQLWDRHVNTFWKPVVVYVKDQYAGPWFGDVVKSDVNDNDKDRHHWGQSESGMADLVRKMSKPGDLVCDPFLGAGTTAAVSMGLGRLFAGSDLSADEVAKTRARLAGTA